MIAYRRFIPRQDQTGPAKVAKAAKVEGFGVPAPAKAMLTPAKAERREPRGANFSSALAELSQPEIAGTLDFSRFSNFSIVPRARVETNGLVAETVGRWAEGVGRLMIMPIPRGHPPAAWQRMLDDAEQFMDRWATQAAALGWHDWEVWGVHRRAPWRRVDAMGLVPLLRGTRLTALTASEAVLVTATGARQTHHRRLHDPLHPAERALVWELAT